MFLLYWKVYVLMVVAVNFLNEVLYCFCGMRTLIDSGVYMRLNGGIGSKVASSLPVWFCILGYNSTGVWLVRVNVVYIVFLILCR